MPNNKPRFLQVKTHKDLVRDTWNNGIINTNTKAADAARLRYKKALETAILEKRHEQELNTLRKDVADLKAMVQMLLEKK